MRYTALIAAALYLFPSVYLPHYEGGKAPETVTVIDSEDFAGRKVTRVHRNLMRLLRYQREHGEDLRTHKW